jgi:hypothetical protein
MPVRIKPIYDLKPCILNLASIQGIISLVGNNFSITKYSASDGIWEIYDESCDHFKDAISERQTLDSFVVKAVEEFAEEFSEDSKELEIIFNENEAKVVLNAHPKHEDWFEHFLIDLKKHLLEPSFSQVVAHENNMRPELYLRVLFIRAPLSFAIFQAPYCKIVIQKKPPNPFVENVKANLFSNLIWALLGILLTLLVQWLSRELGIDLNPFD